ncbi:hypothetical protein D3C71_2041150 [compost metagenome]
MAKTKQGLAIVDQAERQLFGVLRLAGPALQLKEPCKDLLGATAGRCVHLNSAKRAVPLMPASKPLALGSVATSNSVWLPSSIRAPRRLTVASRG